MSATVKVASDSLDRMSIEPILNAVGVKHDFLGFLIDVENVHLLTPQFMELGGGPVIG
jgi:hypothetical protein